MTKIMIFVDGSWLHINQRNISNDSGYKIDYSMLPITIANEISKKINNDTIDIIRKYLIGSYYEDHNENENNSIAPIKKLYHRCRGDFNYETILYQKKKIKNNDKDNDNDNDSFSLEEKCVDVALSTYMLYYAFMPNCYDIAVAVIGDIDYKCALQFVRKLGKRVVIVSIKNSCSAIYKNNNYYESEDDMKIRDFEIIWLDDFAEQLKYKE